MITAYRRQGCGARHTDRIHLDAGFDQSGAFVQPDPHLLGEIVCRVGRSVLLDGGLGRFGHGDQAYCERTPSSSTVIVGPRVLRDRSQWEPCDRPNATTRPTAAEHSDRARSFGSVAADYAQYRPGYPSAALAVALPRTAGVVVDLGAGTGKLTADLIGPGRTVYAVEPDRAMLDQLLDDLPTVIGVQAAAEQVPLPDGCADAVVVRPGLALVRRRQGQGRDLPPAPFRRHSRRAVECRQPRRPTDRGGRAGHEHPRAAAGGAAGRTRPDPPFEPDAALSAPILTTVSWPWRITRARLHALQDTKSYMIAAGPEAVAAVHAGLDAALDEHGVGPSDDDPFDLVQRTEVWVARRT